MTSAAKGWPEGYFRTHALEFGGRLWEWLGFRGMDWLFVRLFGGTPSPRIGDPTATLPENVALETIVRTRYYELVHLTSIVVYIPFVAMIAWIGSQGWTVAAVACLMLNLLQLPMERYRRQSALAARWTEPVQDRIEDEPTSAPAVGFPFRPTRFETDGFFRWTGATLFAGYVRWLSRHAEGPYSGVAGPTSAISGKGSTVAQLVRFEGQTRMAESVHLAAFFLHLPFFIWMIVIGFWPGVVYVGFMLWLDESCAMLQRRHRARLLRSIDIVLARRSRRRSTP